VAPLWLPLTRYFRRRAPADDVDDLLSDVLLVLWRRLDDVPDDHALPWAYKVAQHCLANRRRSQTRHLVLIRRLRDEPGLPVNASDDPALDGALGRLRPADRETLRLWAWEGLEPRELATVLDCTPNAAAVRLSRAKTALRQQLGKDRTVAGHKRDREGEVRQT
jgi:RNA polymerase sigma-70 factor (ECF subfamily)